MIRNGVCGSDYRASLSVDAPGMLPEVHINYSLLLAH
jgi:hypothetical protein